MSRIGKKPILLPEGIDLAIEPGKVIVKNSKASLAIVLPREVSVKLIADPKSAVISVADEDDVKERAYWGLARQLIQNAVIGLQKPFEKSLEFVGVGFRVNLQGRTVVMEVGFSHEVKFDLPEGVLAKVDKQILTLSSADKHLLGETASAIRRLRPPEPYKGKGIKYTDEVIRRKAGKTAVKSA